MSTDMRNSCRHENKENSLLVMAKAFLQREEHSKCGACGIGQKSTTGSISKNFQRSDTTEELVQKTEPGEPPGQAGGGGAWRDPRIFNLLL